MLRKIFLMCLAILLVMPVAAAESKQQPEEPRIPIVLEITNSSRYTELTPAKCLGHYLSNKLFAKQFLDVVLIKTDGDANILPEDVTPGAVDTSAERPVAAQNIGELLVFDVVEVPRPETVVKDFDPNIYNALGAAYIVRCDVMGLGATKVDDKTISAITRLIGSGLSFSGGGNSHRDKVLRHVGTGIGLGGFIEQKRTALNTVVNMQFINAQTGEILWQERFVGQAVKHHHLREGFVNTWEQAYIDSIDETAKAISKRVSKYVDRVIIKGKSDKSFRDKAISFTGLGLLSRF